MGDKQRENSLQGVDRKKDALVITISLLANILLAGLKTSVGVLGHSPALLADGINSTSDVAYSIVVSIFVRLAHKPADDEHPYGHSQLESIGAVVIGSFVITTAIAIFWNSINTIYDHNKNNLNNLLPKDWKADQKRIYLSPSLRSPK